MKCGLPYDFCSTASGFASSSAGRVWHCCPALRAHHVRDCRLRAAAQWLAGSQRRRAAGSPTGRGWLGHGELTRRNLSRCPFFHTHCWPLEQRPVNYASILRTRVDLSAVYTSHLQSSKWRLLRVQSWERALAGYLPTPPWQTGGQVAVTITAPLQVVTPLVRPFFGCSGNQSSCPVNLTSSVTMRYEGV